jgi:hypothetical protein
MLPSDVDQYRVIDTDTHVIEPYDLWTSRLSVAKWGDKVPHVKWDEKLREDAWYFGDQRVGAAARRRRWNELRRSTRRDWPTSTGDGMPALGQPHG